MAAGFDYPSAGPTGPTGSHHHPRVRAFLFYSAALALGILAVVLGVELAALPTKFLVVGLAGVAGLALASVFFGTLPWDRLLLVALVFSIPFHLDKNFFYRMHVAGATSIAVSVTDLAVMAILATRLSRSFANRQLAAIGPLVEWRIVIPVLAFMLSGVLSLVNADHPIYVGLEEIRLLKLLTVLSIVMTLRSHGELRILLLSLAGTVIIQGALAGYQYAFNSTLGLGLFGEKALVHQNIGFVAARANGTLGHPNILGYFLEISTPLMLALAFVERKWGTRLLYGVAFLAGLGGITTTLSRGAWLSLAASLCLVLGVLGLPHLRRLKGVVGMFLVLLVIAAALIPVGPVIYKRFTSDDYHSASSRMPLNQAAWSIVEQFPVVGIGLNNFSEVFKKYDTTGHSRMFKGYRQVVHNLYLWVWAEVGTLGFLAFLSMFGGALLVSWRLFRRAPPWPRGVAIGAGAGLFGHMIHGFVDPGFKMMMNTSVLVFLMFGVLAALHLIARREGCFLPAGGRGNVGA